MASLNNVVFDLETDGLLPELTKIHSLVIEDLDTGQVVSCANNQPGHQSIESGLAILQNAQKVYAHNGISFDRPAIEKIYPQFRLKGKLLDTFVTAAMRWSHIRDEDFARVRRGQLPGNLVGSHSLKAWGFRLGVLKGDFGDTTDWAEWSPEMQQYCRRDVLVTVALVKLIRKVGVSAQAVETEHELAEYLAKQEQNGWPFDLGKAQALQAKLSARRQEVDQQLREFFKPWQVSLGMFTPKVNNTKRGYVKGVPMERFKTVEFNPGSRDHIANRLATLYGWKPSQFTNSGKPQVDENTLKGLPYEPVPMLRDYLLVEKRLGQLSEGKENWINHARLNPQTGLHHIHHRVLQSKAVTHRAAHARPNLAQVPKVSNPYGPECRELFHVPEGWVQIGADAAGLELRCLGHYMARYDDGTFGASVLAEKPNDVHTKNANILGISRDHGKTFIYAFLYGAGDEKLGKIVQPGLSSAKQKKAGTGYRSTFLKGLPALDRVIKAVQQSAKKKGYVGLIDERRCYIRSEHAALNSLLQGTGAVICKRWIVEFNRRLTVEFGPQGWDGKWAALGWIHDEVQIAVKPEIVDRVKELLLESIRHMTQHFNFRVPLDGDTILGSNWKECH